MDSRERVQSETRRDAQDCAMTGDEMVALSKKHTLFEWSAQSKVDPIPIARARGIYFWYRTRLGYGRAGALRARGGHATRRPPDHCGLHPRAHRSGGGVINTKTREITTKARSLLARTFSSSREPEVGSRKTWPESSSCASCLRGQPYVLRTRRDTVKYVSQPP